MCILSIILNVNVSMCYIYRYIYVYRFIRIAYVHLKSNFEYRYSISYEKVQRLALHEVLLQQCKKRQIVPIYRTPVETKKFPRCSTASNMFCYSSRFDTFWGWQVGVLDVLRSACSLGLVTLSTQSDPYSSVPSEIYENAFIKIEIRTDIYL